jgi:hypothetical protein
LPAKEKIHRFLNDTLELVPEVHAVIAPKGGEVVTYHQLGDRICHARGETPDFSRPGAFGRIEAILDDYTPDDGGSFDVLIVDEGQDFEEGWARNLLRFLRPGGRAWWLEDPLQNLFVCPPADSFTCLGYFALGHQRP